MAVFIVAAKRTPFGKFGGAFTNVSATSLGVHATKAALESANVDPAIVDTITVGQVHGLSSSDAIYTSRHIGLKSGMRIGHGSLTVNRLCGSGFQSVITAATDIMQGDASVAVAAGTENMSQFPFVVRDVRFGTKFGANYNLEDSLWSSLTDSYSNSPMGITAENLAKKYDISRRDCEEYAVRTQERFAAAQEGGVLDAEIAPIDVKGRKGPVTISKDEHNKPGTTLESLAKLPGAFLKDGTVTAGTASGICDGAGALVLASEEACKKHSLTPLARLVSWHFEGVEPTEMGIGPAPAIRGALKKAGLSLGDMDLVDVNEAFAAQWLAVAKELNLDMDKANVNGGAIAVGHPLGASGSRITAHLVHELQRRQAKYAVGSACIGGGQGIALILERP